jgi:hypothetical protein
VDLSRLHAEGTWDRDEKRFILARGHAVYCGPVQGGSWGVCSGSNSIVRRVASWAVKSRQ